jgi:type III restriction enzyme
VAKSGGLDNPILNSPYDAPAAHFVLGPSGPTGEVRDGRRPSESFVAVPTGKKAGKGQAVDQQAIDFDITGERREVNTLINDIRARVEMWRARGYNGVTPISRKLLLHWADPTREDRVLFCQREAAETAIFLAEVAGRHGEPDFRTRLEPFNAEQNAGMPRTALKMATGTGKTVVMAMLIAWQALNKLAATHDARFSDTFLLIAPGITIRDRLRVLLPNDPQNYYRQRDIISSELLTTLGQAKILITNYHAFLPREKVAAGKLTKAILGSGESGAFTETLDQMARRVCRELGNKKNIIVINDEAHHCYRRKPDGEDVKLTGDERKEAQKREEDARVWITGIDLN